MKAVRSVLLNCGIVLLFVGFSYADPPNKKNLGFESGTFDGWVGYQWRYSTADDVSNSWNTDPSEVIIPTSRRHIIISDQSAYDPNTGNALKMIPDGYNYSARLGCEIVRSDPNPRCWQQSLRHTMSVDSSNAFLLVKFACVLQYSTSHDNITEMEPHFQFSLYDENENLIDDCSNYDVYSSTNMEEEFKAYIPFGSNNPVMWRDWTTVGADLTSYIGQNITIEFLSADCTGHYHYGYTYFVVDCMPLYITVDFCTDDEQATLSAPSGFRKFIWNNVNGKAIDSVQNLFIPEPKEGETYSCEMESETGCQVTLSAEIARYEQKADFSYELVDCNSNEVQFTNLSTHTKGSLAYLWDFGDGNISEEKDPVYKFTASGMHRVGLMLYNPPSGCTNTVYKDVESFSPEMVGFEGLTTYCPGLETELSAFGAYRYEWSSGDHSETISVGAPGGDYWLLGYSSEGCVSDSVKVAISEEPDWLFSIEGDTFLCHGNNGFLSAEGAVEYLWSTEDKNDSILIFQEGNYRVSGKNARGCQKELNITVNEIPIPDLDFTLSTNSIDSRHNSVECSAWSKDDNVTFYWDLGDGTVSYSPEITHYYSETRDLIIYRVYVTATSEYGCSITKASDIEVEVFVPNVFTPNNDGINDYFMIGHDLQIVDRHGIVMYRGQDGWDGYYKGKQADPDTYFYLLNYVDAYQENRVKKGYITLER